jgi:hypothetical protein
MITSIAYAIGGLREDVNSIRTTEDLALRVQGTYDYLIAGGYSSQRATALALVGNVAYCVIGKAMVILADVACRNDNEQKLLEERLQ